MVRSGLRGRRAYLDDFRQDGDGTYVYTGAVHRYAGPIPRRRALALLWLLAADMALAEIVAGCIPAAGMQNTVYVLLPYVCTILTLGWQIYTLCRFTAGGDPLRDYVYQGTAARFRLQGLLAAGLAAVTLAGETVYLILHGAEGMVGGTVLFAALQGAALAGAVGWSVLQSALRWTREEGTPVCAPDLTKKENEKEHPEDVL